MFKNPFELRRLILSFSLSRRFLATRYNISLKFSFEESKFIILAERNYHIFYQMCSNAFPDIQSEFDENDEE